MTTDFVHLHTHSHYSTGRAVPTVRELVERAAALEMPAIALTDNNSIAGLHELDATAAELGVQPIIGCELDMLPSDHGIYYQGRTHRLVLLVANEAGYRNLVTLISLAHVVEKGCPPHVAFTEFERHAEGLIVLTGSRRSELYYWLREKNTANTKQYLNRLSRAVGPGNLFFEITEYPHPRTRRIMDQVLELSRFLDIPAVATQNVHFLDPEDMAAFAALVQHPRMLAPQWPPADADMPTRHFATPQEMRKRFGYTPELLQQTVRIAERCQFRFPRQRSRLPVPDFGRGVDAPSALWDRVVRGATTRYGNLSQEIKDRLNEEYRDVCDDREGVSDMAGYLLLLQDQVNAAREEGYCTGAGRGEFAGSVIAYTLGLTETDPIGFDIPYSPLRPTPEELPTFDMEVSPEGERFILAQLRENIGKQHVAGVGQRVDWPRQRLFQHLCRWAGLPVVSLRQFSSKINAQKKRTVPPQTLVDQEYDPEPAEGEYDARWDEPEEDPTDEKPGHSPWLQDPRIPREKSLQSHQTLAEIAHTLSPCPRGFRADRHHYVVAKEPLHTVVPIVVGEHDQRVCQAEGPFLQRLQVPSIRFSNAALMDVLETATRCVQREDAPHFQIRDISLQDDQTFRLLGLGLTNGILPMHKITSKSLLRANAPGDLKALVDVHVHASRRRRDSVPDDAPGAARKQMIGALPEALLSYWCAYLKAHHPVSFFVAMLSHSLGGGESEDHRPRFQILLREARKMHIQVLGPYINSSDYYFTQEHNRIRTGLMVVQGLGEKTWEEIKKVRKEQAFSSLSDFCQRTDPRSVPQSVIANLIRAGAFDALKPNRTQLLHEFERALKNARQNTRRVAGAGSRNNSGEETQLQLFDNYMFEQQDNNEPATENAGDEILSDEDIVRHETEGIGFPISVDLMEHYERVTAAMRALSPFDLSAQNEQDLVHVAGFIDHIEREGPLIDEETALVLDLEGYVVKVPSDVRDVALRLASTRDPVLVGGVLRKRGRAESFLIARHLYLLEEVSARSQGVVELHLNLEGQPSRSLGEIRQVLGRYRGRARVRIEPKDLGWWKGRGIDGMRTFFCPPLYQRLRRLLPDTRIAAYDANGEPVRF